jgi:hypothetical protein
MARREIVFLRPTRWWQNGLSLGNGDLMGAVFGGGSSGPLSVALSKVDVWDERYDREGYRLHTLAELRELIQEHSATPEGRSRLNSLEPYCKAADPAWYRESYPYPPSPPTCKPVGVVTVDPGGSFDQFECRLSIHRGEVSFLLSGDDGEAEARFYIDAGSNVLAVTLRRRGSFSKPIFLEISRYRDGQLGEPELRAEVSGLGHRYLFPDGFSYALWATLSPQAEGKEMGTREWKDLQAMTGWSRAGEMRIWDREIEGAERYARLTLPPSAGELRAFVGVATSRESRDPPGLAKRTATSASKDPDNLRNHRAWWDRFWRRSSLTVSDRMIESLWYQGLYLLACQSRGAGPPPIVGPGYLLSEQGENEGRNEETLRYRRHQVSRHNESDR